MCVCFEINEETIYSLLQYTLSKLKKRSEHLAYRKRNEIE